ncbi:RHS repeat-associated core domain-containing protein [Vibrio harveyi]
MNLQRIVKLKALSGAVFCFSHQRLNVGIEKEFGTENCAAVFIEQFHFASLDDLREIASWTSKEVSFAHEYEDKGIEELDQLLAKGLYDRVLFVSELPKLLPKTFYPPTNIPQPVALKASKGARVLSRSERVNASSSVSLSPQDESSKRHVKAGDPVSMVTGEEHLSLVDVRLPFHLTWLRTYRSSLCDTSTSLGFGWRHIFQYELMDVLDEKSNVVGWLFMDEVGDTIQFPSVEIGGISYQAYSGASCLFHKNGYRLVSLRNEVQIKFYLKDELWVAREVRLGHMKTVNLEYSRNHRVVGVSVNQKPKLELQYDEHGLLVEIRTPKTNHVLAKYDYDAGSRLICAKNENGLIEKYQYNDSNLLVKRTRATGFSHYFEWLGEGKDAKCVRNWGDEGVYDYRFDIGLYESTYWDSLGNRWQYKHDENGKLLERISPESRLMAYEHDSMGRLACTTNPDKSYTFHFYDEFGLMKQKVHSSGAIEDFEYNEFGQCIKHRFPDGEVEIREFNALGQLVMHQYKNGLKEHSLFDKHGRQVEQNSDVGTRTQWWWSEANQLLAKKVNQCLIRYSYDEYERINGISYPHDLIAGFERHENNLLTRLYFQSKKDQTFREHRYEYDDFGRVKQICTPRGSIDIVWGHLAQPTAIVKQDQSAFSFSYDSERNLTSIERSDGCKYEFEYTPDGHISQTINFDRIKTNYTYDRAERLSQISHCSILVSFQYDELGQVAKVKASGKSRSVENHYQHTLGGKLTRAHNRFSNISYTYSGTKLVSEEQGRFSFVNQYQDNGLLRSQRYDDGTEVLYEHDQFGTVCGLTIHSNGSEREDSIKFEYDELQRLSIITYSAGKELREFDGIGRLKRQIWTGFERRYHYNAQHLLSLIVDSEKGALHYRYDELGQLERVKTQTLEKSYSFDSFGNFNDESAQLDYDRLVEYNGVRYDYDELGNRIRTQGNGWEQHCAYDAKGQLISVETEGRLCQFEYDALGRRTKQISENGTTEFIWQGSHLVGEYSRSGYRWYLYQPNSVVPLALIENGKCYFFQCNQIGTPERLVDSKGQVVWQATYDTFGFAHVEIETVKNNLRLQGQYFDIETGLHYNLARYYDPQIGRFIQPDPLGLLGGTNHYQFAPNPVSWVDPLGLCAKEESHTVLAGRNDNSPEKSVYYAMGSGNYQATITQASPSYKLHAYSSPHHSALSINDVHMALDAAGMLPGVGIIPDAVNTFLYGVTGDFVNAGMSLSAMVPVVGQGAMATKYVSELDKIEGHGNNIADNVSTHIDDYVSRLYSKVTPSNRPANLFEIEQTGPRNYRVFGGGTSIDIDGYEGTVILEAKFVDKKSRSPFIEDSKIPPFLREKIRKEQAHEFERFKAVLKDSEVPFNKLEVRINEPLAKPYFQSLIEKYKIPGHVKVVRTSIKESGGG